ncbi:MAG: aldehyde dehydrogenase family protein [Firmicutes bacterium]|nr:aldehyde dehydrogenase family protein [Bacillota bacterium]
MAQAVSWTVGRTRHHVLRALEGRTGRAWAAVAVILLAAVPALGQAYATSLALAILAHVAMASAWSLFSGLTGYMSLAAAAFYGVGAYTTFLFNSGSVWPGPVVVGAAVAAALAFVAGGLTLRLRGPYFAILTFGLAELVHHLVSWYEFSFTRTVGRMLLFRPSLNAVYYTMLVVAAVTVSLAFWIRRSRWGLALMAIGNDEERADVLGVRPTWIKIGVFVLSAALMGATGATNAARWTYLDPQIAFNPLISFQTVIMAMLGGAAQWWGPVAGAVFIGLIAELFLVRFRYAYMIALGVVLIGIVLLLPHGIAGWYLEERTGDLVRTARWSVRRRMLRWRRFGMARRYQMFIDGQWQDAPGGQTFPDRNPATGEAFAHIPAGNAETARRAVEAASRAQREWAELTAAERSAVLLRAADIWERRSETLAKLLTEETGSIAKKRMFEVGYCKDLIRQAASLAYEVGGEIAPSNVRGKVNHFIRQPAGVVSVISPWNFPYILTLRAVAPALALGNTVVLKPSEESPIAGGLVIAEIFEEAGVPPGVLNVITCPREGVQEVGEVLVGHPDVRVISFTGSTFTGRKLAELAGRHLKRIILELGGKSPIIVLEDADLDLATSAACFGGFFHQGQICMASSRLIVEQPVAEQFTSQLVEKVRHLKIGDPNDLETDIGPIISPTQLAKIQEHVEDAVSKGARLLTGGRARGPYFEPTVLAGVTPEMRVYYEETFGPVVSVIPVKDAEEAVQVANDTMYGLSAGIITQDPERGMQLAGRLETGMAHINDSSMHDEPHAPFGGIKASGLGRHGGKAAIEAFTETRWISLQAERRHYPFDR